MSWNQKLMTVMMLALVCVVASSSPISADLILTQGGFDQETLVGGLPAAPFTSPLGEHTHSANHNTAWTASANHMWGT